MIMTKDNIIDRDQLQHDYIERIIDGMDHKDIWQFVYETLEQNFDKYTCEEIIGEVEEYYPDLLDSWRGGTGEVAIRHPLCL